MPEKVDPKHVILDDALKELIIVLKRAKVLEDPLKGLKKIEAAAEIYLMLMGLPLS